MITLNNLWTHWCFVNVVISVAFSPSVTQLIHLWLRGQKVTSIWPNIAFIYSQRWLGFLFTFACHTISPLVTPAPKKKERVGARLYLNVHTGSAIYFISNENQSYCECLKHETTEAPYVTNSHTVTHSHLSNTHLYLSWCCHRAVKHCKLYAGVSITTAVSNSLF